MRVKVTIIGGGKMGHGIGARMLAAQARLQVLDLNRPQAERLGRDLGGDVQAGQLGQDPIDGDVVVLAVPYSAVDDIITEVGEQLAGRIVVDITNPVDLDTFDGLVTPPDSSAAQEIAQRLPSSRVVKAFNTILADTLADGRVDGEPLDVLIAADDTGAAHTLGELVSRAGLRPIPVGPLRRARELESMGYLHLAVQEPIHGDYHTALKVMT